MRSFWSLVVVLSAGLVLAAPAGAANMLHVTKNADSGAGSLRDAILTSSAGDTIVFDLPLTGGPTITLTSGELVLSHDLTITGPGASALTVSGNHNSRIFDITGGAISISGLTIADGSFSGANAGDGGGGIVLNSGSLDLSQSVVTGNSATVTGSVSDDGGGGILNNFGVLTIDHTAVTGNSFTATATSEAGGGGFFNNVNGGTVTITDSSFTDNTSTTTLSSGRGGGGGIYNKGNEVDLTRSLVANNTATSSTSTNNGGGGVFDANRVVLTNSTVSGNSMTVDGAQANNGGGGVWTTGDTPGLLNSTVTGNSTNGAGGGVFNRSSATGLAFANSILAGNTDKTGPNNCGGAAGITSNGHNLVSDLSCALAAGDLTGVDPMLGTLQDNGGPSFTLALLPGSPAIGTADPVGCPADDQRGLPRKQFGVCDIGAYEFQPLAPVVTTGAASGLNVHSATLAGSVVPAKAATTAHFEFGATTAYGSQTPGQALGSGSTAAPVTASLNGLNPGTTYHYRLVATNAVGTTLGADRTFTTTTTPAPVISRLSMSPKRWRLGTALPRLSRKPPVGTKISFTLDTGATAVLSFRRVVTGHRAGGKCRPGRGRRPCRRLGKALPLRVRAHSGANVLSFQGRLSRKRRLGPGRYRLTVVALGTQGGKSKALSLTFTVLPAK